MRMTIIGMGPCWNSAGTSEGPSEPIINTERSLKTVRRPENTKHPSADSGTVDRPFRIQGRNYLKNFTVNDVAYTPDT